MTLCQKCHLFLISEFSWKHFVTENEINQFLFVSHAVDVPAYVLRVVWWLWSTANLFKCSNGVWYRRKPPRLVNLHSFGLVNLHSFGLVACLVNTLPKRPPYATETHPKSFDLTQVWAKSKKIGQWIFNIFNNINEIILLTKCTNKRLLCHRKHLK